MLKIALVTAAAILSVAMLAGCQSVNKIEYYEPNAQNAAYSTPSTEKTQGHGPVKSIEGKSGVPDFSDNKTFRFSLSVLGL